jgi:MFS family permease
MPKLTAGPTAFTVLGLCFALTMLGRGAAESFSVFLLPIAQAFDWDRAQVVSIYSTAALAAGLASPVVGRLFDRSGPRTVYGCGLLLLGIGFSAAPYAQALWHLQLSIGLASGLGTACLGNVTGSLLLGRWFGPRLPTAMAIVYSASGAGTLALLPLSQLLIDRLAWRGAYQVLGGAMLVLAALVLLLPWRRLAAGSATVPRPSSAAGAAEDWTLARAVRHHAFWALLSTYFFTAIGMFALSAQVVAYLVEAGFSPLEAATAWGSSGVFMVLGMLTVSLLDSVIGRRRAILLSYTLSTSGMVMLWFLGRFPSAWLLFGFLLCFGSTHGSRGPLISAAAMSIFRGRRVGEIFGAILLGSGLGAALGSWIGGLIHDWTGSYDWVIAFALLNVLLGMAPFLVVPMLRR